jgi:hypothetical protein
MAKERVIRQMTEEQRQRILNTPGVVVHQRSEPPSDPFFVPRLRARTPGKLTATELINSEADESDHLSR